MKRNFPLKFFLSILLFFFFLIKGASTALGAASLSLSPTTGNVVVGGTLSVEVKLDTGGTATTGVDVVITFNPQVLQVASTLPVVPGSLYRDQPAPTIDNTTGKLVLHYGVTSTAYAYTSQPGAPGLLATINFTGKAAGTSTIAFTCTQGVTQNDTNVWTSSVTDIVNCASNTGGSYTVTAAGGEPTSTPTPGGGGETQVSPTPSQLLDAGATEWTFLFLALGIFFTLGGIRLLLAKRI